MNTVVKCHGVSRVYDDEVAPVHALRNVDFRLEPGEFVSLAGPSGKTWFVCELATSQIVF